MRWSNDPLSPNTVEVVRTLLPQGDEDTWLLPRLQAHVQARITALVPAAPFAPVPPPAVADLVPCLAAFLGLEEARAQKLLPILAVAPRPPWTPSGLPGLHVYPLTGGSGMGGATGLLVSLAPGHALPLHRHQGEEWTLLLQGWVQEDDGHCWGPGDRLHRAPGSVHAFSTLAATPCLCAVVNDGGVEFVGARPAVGDA
jgi:quercetin dioxygenase-like cupin family protein